MAAERNRRAADKIAGEGPTLLLISLDELEIVSMHDALLVALAGGKRRAGDEQRWRHLLAKLSAWKGS